MRTLKEVPERLFSFLTEVKHKGKNISFPACYQEKELIFTNAVLKGSSDQATKSPEMQVLNRRDNWFRQSEKLVMLMLQ